MFSNYVVSTPEVLCNLAESDLTRVVPTCDDLLETNYIEIPGSNVADSETRSLDFVYKGSPSIFLDPNNSQVYLTCQLVDSAGTPVTSTNDKVGAINHLGKSNTVFPFQ